MSGTVQEEVVAWKHPEFETFRSLIAPGFQAFVFNLFILETSEDRDRAIKRFLFRINISLAKLKICPDYGQHQLHQFGMLKYTLRRAVQTAKTLHKFRI